MDYKFINTEYLEMVAGGDNGLLKELIDLFRDQVSEFNTEMRLLLNEKNYQALGRLAHKAKSSVAIMGMDSLANMLKTFELQAVDSRNPEKYEAYITRFENETLSALEELDDLVKNL
ncbi:MAG TPA: Hpt domain-containing protein [Bacteroidales bacterium]|jgi:HPt (histidine-containing phosphotransfer) domain-containing protein|nr:Hpt domain-containing protein [Bacteroidales bacterium]